MLPVNLAKPLERHLQKIKAQHEEDLEAGFGTVYLPGAIERKSPNAASEWAWQYVFRSSRLSVDARARVNPGEPVEQRHHTDESLLQEAVKKAVRAAGNIKLATFNSTR